MAFKGPFQFKSFCESVIFLKMEPAQISMLKYVTHTYLQL